MIQTTFQPIDAAGAPFKEIGMEIPEHAFHASVEVGDSSGQRDGPPEWETLRPPGSLAEKQRQSPGLKAWASLVCFQRPDRNQREEADIIPEGGWRIGEFCPFLKVHSMGGNDLSERAG